MHSEPGKQPPEDSKVPKTLPYRQGGGSKWSPLKLAPLLSSVTSGLFPSTTCTSRIHHQDSIWVPEEIYPVFVGLRAKKQNCSLRFDHITSVKNQPIQKFKRHKIGIELHQFIFILLMFPCPLFALIDLQPRERARNRKE